MDDHADRQSAPPAAASSADGPDSDGGEDRHGHDDSADGDDRSDGHDRDGESGDDRSDGHDRDGESGDDGRDVDHGHETDGDDGHDSEHGHDHHDHHDHLEVSDLCVAVLTVSSTRTIEEDAAGDAIVEEVEAAGHEVVVRELVNDSYDGIQQAVDRFVDREDTDCVVTTGGTGVTPDDETIEAVEPLLDKQLPGFGELFRTLSYEEVGTRAVSTRATAGVADAVGVFCLPGSENAARLGTREIVVPESPHLVGLARQSGQDLR